MIKILSLIAGIITLVAISAGFVYPALVNTTLIPAWMVAILIIVYSFVLIFIFHKTLHYVLKLIQSTRTSCDCDVCETEKGDPLK